MAEEMVDIDDIKAKITDNVKAKNNGSGLYFVLDRCVKINALSCLSCDVSCHHPMYITPCVVSVSLSI